MSDDEVGGLLGPYVGVTLPDDTSATHNVRLSPLFFVRSGQTPLWNTDLSWWQKVVFGRGASTHYWSASANNDLRASFFYNIVDIQSSNNEWRYLAYSLRCLVSTNNG